MQEEQRTREYSLSFVEDWGSPVVSTIGDVAGVAVDSRDLVYAFTRATPGVQVLTPDGESLEFWPLPSIRRAHSIKIDVEDRILLVDDDGHAVYVYTEGRRLVLSIRPSAPSDNGYNPTTGAEVVRAGPPFAYPTDVAVGRDGRLFVTDGYGNARVHIFEPDGHLIDSWGAPGTGPREFRLPHGISLDDEGNLLVADRENSRVQIFTPTGAYLGEWEDVRRPCAICPLENGLFAVAEVGRPIDETRLAITDPRERPRVSIRNRLGAIIAECDHPDPLNRGAYFAPHALARDARGAIYIGDVGSTNSLGAAPPGVRLHKIQVHER